jgi:RNA polymerase sigma-70 factor, ECF subfamily
MAWHSSPGTASVRAVQQTGEYILPPIDARTERMDWPDEVLMHAIAAARDEAAFSVLYDRYVDLVYSASLRVLSDTQLAEDATQDIFVRLWRRPETFVAERGRFLAWLMSVVRNRAVDELRARGRRRRREGQGATDNEDDLMAALPSEGDDPLTAAQLHEEQVLIRGALCHLPKEQRLALELAYFSGLTQQEIAVFLHQPLGTVKTRIRLGMQKLRRALHDQV